MNIQDLKEKSINVTNETITYSPVYSKELTIDMSEIGAHYIGCYAVNNATINNSTICFVTGDSEVFVCPYTREARRVLEEEGYVLNYFYVPFSCGEIPKNAVIDGAAVLWYPYINDRARRTYDEVKLWI